MKIHYNPEFGTNFVEVKHKNFYVTIHQAGEIEIEADSIDFNSSIYFTSAELRELADAADKLQEARK